MAPRGQADLLRQPAPGMDAPSGIAFSPGGRALTYLWSANASNVRQLWWHELRTGDRRIIAEAPGEAAAEESLTAEERLRRQRTHEVRLGITDYAWAADADVLISVVAGTCLVSRGGEQAWSVDDLAQIQAAALSPDGVHIAAVRAGDIYVADADEIHSMPLRLTHDAGPGVFNGLPEFIAAEELDRHVGLWWSADSAALAWAHVDERHIPPFAISHLGADVPTSEEHRYPFAGGPNARVTLRTAEARAPSRDVDLGMADGDYLARVLALPLGGWLVAVLPRDQRSLRWLRVTAQGSADELWVERNDPWINLDDDTRGLADGRILRSTEESGFRHLEVRTADGRLERRLTAGPWVVTEVNHVDLGSGEVLFTATAEGVLERHLYAVSLDRSQPDERPRRLTDGPGWHEVVVSRDGSAWVDTWSTRLRAPQVDLHVRGESTTVIHPSSANAAELGLAHPELQEVTAGDGRTPLHVARYPPTPPTGAAEPSPCVVWVYSGPHSQYVRDAWDLTIHPTRQALARAGFVVLTVDGRGTANRGTAFEAALDHALGSVEVEDQVAALEALVSRGEVDPARIGITGGSYGGYMTIRCLLRRPEIFRAGVASAPVTAWDGYDTAYTERYLGGPGDNLEAYAEASLLGDAPGLIRPLLIEHGALDENVHLRHTGRLLAALQGAGRNAELLLVPGERHLFRARAALERRERATVAFLCRELGLPEPEGGQAAPGAKAASEGAGEKP